MTTISLSKRVAEEVIDKHKDFTLYRNTTMWRDLEMNSALLSDEALNMVVDHTAKLDEPTKDEKATVSLANAVLRIRGGEEKVISKIAELHGMLPAWVDTHCERGWLIRKHSDGSQRDQAYLVTSVNYSDGRREMSPSVSITMVANAPGVSKRERGEGRSDSRVTASIHVTPDDLLTSVQENGKRKRHTVASLLESEGFFIPTEKDLADHDQTEQEFEKVLATGFAKQYRHTGSLEPVSWSYTRFANENGKVIHDVAPHERLSSQPVATVWDSNRSEEVATRTVPMAPRLRIFELDKQEFFIVDSRDITEYVYDQSLREKLILPESHRELLDVLTTDLEDYTDDIIEGKSAGNVILAQGKPGIGKTLTAEVYAEIIERPLYAIHSGSLGINAESVRKNLETIFARAARWDAVLLLDEADVFVIERGQSITQNAIVAEFLRTLEYFKGLLFMTTNRHEEIDDAILSRCAAIIKYVVPDKEDARKVWKVMVANAKSAHLVPDDLIESLLESYPHLTPRDVKMVLRLALRISAKRNEKPTLEVFKRCILFRGLTSSAEPF